MVLPFVHAMLAETVGNIPISWTGTGFAVIRGLPRLGDGTGKQLKCRLSACCLRSPAENCVPSQQWGCPSGLHRELAPAGTR